MQYKAYEIRRELLAYNPDNYTRGILILLEYIDWSTGIKEATSAQHMENWLNQLCTKNNLEWSDMVEALNISTQIGWIKRYKEGDKFILRIGDKPAPSLKDRVAAPAPVAPEVEVKEGEEVPYHQRPNWQALTRERIRELAVCPKCGAEQGLMCKGEQKGKNNRIANHKERSQAASKIAKELYDMNNQ